MFQFLQPILLLSIAGIAIPLVIHLWNIKPGKTLKIGSIALLSQGSRQNARSFKLSELLLLFLRCLLLTLFAFMISKPIWKQQVFANKEKGWIMLEKESLHEGYKNNKSTIDSLLKAGYDFHYFNTAFKKDNLKEVLKIQKDTIVSISNTVSYWSLLKQLNQEVPTSLPVYLFTNNRLNRFTGERPQLSLNLHWQTYITSDSVSVWPEKAFINSADSVQLLVGHSKPSGTSYTHKNLSLAQLSNAEYDMDVINGKLTVSLKEKAVTIAVDTSTIKITVFTDKFNSDAHYVKAAILAIGSFSKRKLQLLTTNNYKNIPANQDWIFWLSEQPVPALATANNIFMYERGKTENINSWITTQDLFPANLEAISLSKAIAHNSSNQISENIWLDGFGNSLLNKEAKNNVTFFHFYSRFNPEWCDLPWSKEFPKLLFQLIFQNENDQTDTYDDKRMIDESQMQPSMGGKLDTGKNDKFTKTTELTHLFWVACFVIFFMERLLTFKTKNAATNA